MLIDTHSHLNFSDFDKDREEIIEKCLKNRIWIINVGIDYQTSRKAVEISRKYKQGVYAAVGLHPLNFKKKFDYKEYKKLASDSKVVAIGEIGLDYYYKPKTKRKLEVFKEGQKELLLKQLKLAKELDLPIILHCRLALDDMLTILKSNIQYLKPNLPGIIHCFTGNLEQLDEFLRMGFFIGFNGIIFKQISGIDFEILIKRTPLKRILIETDCPYLLPPEFSEKRNNPFGVKLVAEKIASIKGISFEDLSKITTENAITLFGLFSESS